MTTEQPPVDRRAQLLGDAMFEEAVQAYRRPATRERYLRDLEIRGQWRRTAARVIARLEAASHPVELE